MTRAARALSSTSTFSSVHSRTTFTLSDLPCRAPGKVRRDQPRRWYRARIKLRREFPSLSLVFFCPFFLSRSSCARRLRAALRFLLCRLISCSMVVGYCQKCLVLRTRDAREKIVPCTQFKRRIGGWDAISLAASFCCSAFVFCFLQTSACS